MTWNGSTCCWLEGGSLTIGLGLRAWWTGTFNAILPSPARVGCWWEHGRQGIPQPVEDCFRVVLCWLENDDNGNNARYVEQAFRGVEGEGVTLVRSARIVGASGAADAWREAMRRKSACSAKKVACRYSCCRAGQAVRKGTESVACAALRRRHTYSRRQALRIENGNPWIRIFVRISAPNSPHWHWWRWPRLRKPKHAGEYWRRD